MIHGEHLNFSDQSPFSTDDEDFYDRASDNEANFGVDDDEGDNII